MSKQHKPEQQLNQNGPSLNIGRHGFIQTSSLALLAGALSQPEFASTLAPSMNLQESNQQETPFFRADKYTKEEVDELYGRGLRTRATRLKTPKSSGANANVASAEAAITVAAVNPNP